MNGGEEDDGEDFLLKDDTNDIDLRCDFLSQYQALGFDACEMYSAPCTCQYKLLVG